MQQIDIEGLTIGNGCEIHPSVVFEIDSGAHITLGNRVSIRRGTTIQANRGSQIWIGDDVALGENVFISAMVGIVIGAGVGVSNQVDVRDHNHAPRTSDLGDLGLQPWSSGFTAAPIFVEKGALLSNKVTVTAGVYIGRNSIVGANSVVTRHVEPDVVVGGVPCRLIREFDGKQTGVDFRPPFAVGWVGTSIMEHRQATSEALEAPWPVPQVGDEVRVTGIETGGFVRSVTDDLSVRFPFLRIETNNFAIGGATSRDLASVCSRLSKDEKKFDVVFFGCGLNDVWRGFQCRKEEAVGLPEFIENIASCIEDLNKVSRHVIYLEETCFGPELEGLPTHDMNAELLKYMSEALSQATLKGCTTVPVTRRFMRTAMSCEPAEALWRDGIHLSRLGDHLLGRLVFDHLQESKTMERLLEFPSLDRERAPEQYKDVIAEAAGLLLGSSQQ